MQQEVSIPTEDGEARAYVFTPDAGDGPWPAVILYMDAPAIRPALFEMGERMAQGGYYVLLPDMFWRVAPYPPLDIAKARAGDAEQQQLFMKLRGSTDAEKAMHDTGAFLAWLDEQPQADAGMVGVAGYCMGGGFALRAAGRFPEKVAAAAAFHGGGLATDEADSPHKLAPKIRAQVLVAGADEDRSFDEAQKDRLAAALKEAGVHAEVGIWKGLKHGWVPADMPVHDAAGAERHWQALFALFDATLKPAAA